VVARHAAKLPLLALLLWSGMAPAASEALLRPRVMVDGDSVTLGDLFDNAGERAGLVVMRAPAPGRRTSVNNDWLAHLALVNGISWRPRGLFEDAVIERAGVAVDNKQLMDALQDSLSRQGAPDDCLLEIDGGAPPLVVATTAKPQILVKDLYYDRDRQRFTGTVTVTDQAGEASPELARQPISGHLFATITVPVLNQSLGKGDIVKPRDLGWLRLRPELVRAATITDPDLVIGMTAKQSLRAGQPLTVTDLQKPLAVTRGALVTLLLNHGGMVLTAQGRADDQGALGDVIHVTNTHSNQIIQGTIIGTSQVRVTLDGTIAFAN
jgi:flagella basal body P-ring formation protein FlgA